MKYLFKTLFVLFYYIFYGIFYIWGLFFIWLAYLLEALANLIWHLNLKHLEWKPPSYRNYRPFPRLWGRYKFYNRTFAYQVIEYYGYVNALHYILDIKTNIPHSGYVTTKIPWMVDAKPIREKFFGDFL